MTHLVRTRIVLAFAASAIAIPVLTYVVSFVLRVARTDPALSVSPVHGALIYAAVATVAASALAIRGDMGAKVAVMAELAYYAPLAAVMMLRLSSPTCTGVNLFGLPWPDGVSVIVRIFCGLLIVVSTVAIGYGFTRRELRPVSIALSAFSLLAILPAGFLYFLTVFGDPGPDCVAY